MRIQTPLTDFLSRYHPSLIHFLTELVRTQALGDEDLLSTRALCERVFHSRSYGLRIIKWAEKDGYITRTEGSSQNWKVAGRKRRGGGKSRVCKVTQKGLGLLEQLGAVKV